MRWLAVLAALVCIVAARPAWASPQARLVYARGDGAASCPDEVALRRAVAVRIGYDPFFPWAPRTVVVTIDARGDELAAHVQLVDDDSHGSGARDFGAAREDCVGLIDRIALTISIAIDPRVLAGPQATPEASDAGSPATDEPNATKSDARTDVPVFPVVVPPVAEQAEAHDALRPTSPGRLVRGAQLGVVARSALGTEPSPAVGVAVSGALVFPHFSLGLDASVDAPGRMDAAGGSVLAWVAAGSFVPCARLGPARACGLVSLGMLEGYANGFAVRESHAALYAAAGGRAGFEWPLGATLAFVAQADLLGDFTRAALRVGTDDVWRASPVSLALGAGLAVHFP